MKPAVQHRRGKAARRRAGRAAAARRYRQQVRQDTAVYGVALDRTGIEGLIAAGRCSEAQALDRTVIAREAETVLAEWAAHWLAR